MREIRSEGIAPKLLFSSTGALKQLRTGDDGYVEQGYPAERLLPRLCTAYTVETSKVAAHRINEGHLVQFIELPRTAEVAPEAIIGFNGPAGPYPYGMEQKPLDSANVLYSLNTFHSGVAGAVAWGNFAIRVQGASRVEALAQFHRAILAGDVAMLAGSRHEGNPHGVVLVNLKALTSDELSLLESDPETYLRTSFRRAAPEKV